MIISVEVLFSEITDLFVVCVKNVITALNQHHLKTIKFMYTHGVVGISEMNV